MKFVKTTPKSLVNIWNSKAQTIILNTNAEGKMHGIAKGLMNYDLEAASEYMRLCARGEVLVGTPVRIRSNKHRGQQYILCPIKARSGDAPRINTLDLCLKTIRANATIWDIQSIATHPMGCGSSDVYLNWEQVVYPMYRYYMGDAPIDITVYGASDPTPAPVIEDEPVTTVVPVVKPITMPLDPVLARAAFDLSEKDWEEIYGTKAVIEEKVKVEEWIVMHYTNPLWSIEWHIGQETKHKPGYVAAGQIRIMPCERVLEELFEMTQNIEQSWHELPCVIPGQSERSTSSGDVFLHLDTSRAYRVVGGGFDRIDTKEVFA